MRPFYLTIFFLIGLNPALFAADRPNILWITCEDTSPHFGCYDDDFAITPNVDALAEQGVRYTNAFAYTGVCAPSRSCLITGLYPLRLGSQNMRSSSVLPKKIRCFTEYLRDAGYYCTNNSKEDYNFKRPETAWDESSKKAHWRNRKAGQPFFSIFNFTVCHQSQIFCSEKKYQSNTKRLTEEQRHDPANVFVPPIHPDIPEFRKEWARHYDNVTAMDYQVGDVLKQLNEDDLEENTIVFFYSDHGTGMPSIKMFAWGPGLEVPLVIRFPKKYEHLAPTPPGETTDRLVNFVDFGPTALSLAGVKVPKHMQGRAFLGEQETQPRDFVFGGKERQAECVDLIRYVRNQKFQYNRNFHPELPFGQYMSYVWNHDSMQAWYALHQAGELSGPTAKFFAVPKPIEELYDVHNDPWQVNNLAKQTEYESVLNQMRAELKSQMLAAGDLGLLPEREMHSRSESSTPYEIATNQNLNPIEKLWDAANVANEGDPKNILQLIHMLSSQDSAIRWWGALGFVTLKEHAKPAERALILALQDSSPDVRIAAAEALAQLGEIDLALPVLKASLSIDDPFVRLSAMNVIQRIGPPAKSLIPTIKRAGIKSSQQKDVASYVSRMVGYVPEQLSE
ncbi:MAG: sulfatase-like hydrolase/transferase [Planctomycetaceae bacterium]|nr:sulfatase-like hydrolase/transferase [Planctomycetaceae bacterium]